MNALEQMYERVSATIYGLALRMADHSGGQAAAAERITEQALVQLWRTASAYDPDECEAMTWITAQAHRLAVQHLRAEHARPFRRAGLRRRSDRPRQHGGHRGLSAAEHGRAVELTFFGGYTDRQVAGLLAAWIRPPSGTASAPNWPAWQITVPAGRTPEPGDLAVR